MPRDNPTKENLQQKGYVEVSPGKWRKMPSKPSSCKSQVIKPVKDKSLVRPAKTIVKVKPKHDDGFRSDLERDFNLKCMIWKSQGRITDYLYERFKVILGEGHTYLPDFLLIYDHGDGLFRFEVHETKGPFARPKAIANLKDAANLFPWMDWFLTTRNDLGQWCFKHFPPIGRKSWKTPRFEEES